jgi:predicted PurR-regulated permease PerM
MTVTEAEAPTDRRTRTDDDSSGALGRLARRVLISPLILAALLSVAYLTWQVRVELVVLFAALLFGVSLHAAARWLSERTGLGHRMAVVAWTTAVFLVLGGFFLLTQQRLASQYGEFGERLPQALEVAENRIQGVPIIGTVGGQLEQFRESLTQDGSSGGGSPDDGTDAQETSTQSGGGESQDSGGTSRSMQVVQITLLSLGRIGLVIILAFYMAFDGRRYVRSLLMLFPKERRDVGTELIRGVGRALPQWLLGRLSSMAVVALLTAPGLMLLGIPLAFVLALIAGLFSFVPVLGPIASVVPAVLITLEAAPDKLVWVLGLYGIVQVLESWFITPRIQDRMADVPPVLLLSAQFILGALVGTVGVMFSTPLALAGLVTVQVLYLRRGLGEPVRLPGEPDEGSA